MSFWCVMNCHMQVAQRIKSETPNADIRVVKCVLEDLESVAAAAKEVLALGLPLNTLMLNAGVMMPPFTLTKQGLELQMGVNHVAHALLVRHLLPNVVATARWGAKVARYGCEQCKGAEPTSSPFRSHSAQLMTRLICWRCCLCVLRFKWRMRGDVRSHNATWSP